MTKCFWNGEIVPLDTVAISPLDLGFLRAYAVYEGVAAFDGEPFHFDDHYERLRASAHTIGLAIPYTNEQLLTALRDVLRANELSRGRASMRIVLSGGEADHGIGYNPGNETCIVLAEQAHEPVYTEGGSLLLHEFQRNLPTCKTVEYAVAVSLQSERVARNAAEILYHTKGELRECATSNVFLVKDGVLITPDKEILLGITRKITIDIAHSLGYVVEERTVLLTELETADEIFITSSFRDIMPITRIEDSAVGAQKIGSVTEALIQAFKKKY